MPKLGVNIDHVATLREARKGCAPDPIEAALACMSAGCDSIVCHLREDRRHINDKDVKLLRRLVKARLNLEMSVAAGIVDIACAIKPDQATLVPEKRREITTEGGLDVKGSGKSLQQAIERLKDKEIGVSFFIDPDTKQIDASSRLGVDCIELHTGEYANARTDKKKNLELERLRGCVQYAVKKGLRVNAGHGLTYINVKDVARLPAVEELNIGHSIVSRAVLVGMDRAVKEMLGLIS